MNKYLLSGKAKDINKLTDDNTMQSVEMKKYFTPWDKEELEIKKTFWGRGDK